MRYNIMNINNQKKQLKVRVLRYECLTKRNEISIILSEYFNISKNDLLSKSRKRKFSQPRMICYYLLYELKYKKSHIAHAFNINHASVIYGIEKMQELFSLYDNDRLNIEDKVLVEDIKYLLKINK